MMHGRRLGGWVLLLLCLNYLLPGGMVVLLALPPEALSSAKDSERNRDPSSAITPLDTQ